MYSINTVEDGSDEGNRSYIAASESLQKVGKLKAQEDFLKEKIDSEGHSSLWNPPQR
jgi:hypothetical protein